MYACMYVCVCMCIYIYIYHRDKYFTSQDSELLREAPYKVPADDVANIL